MASTVSVTPAAAPSPDHPFTESTAQLISSSPGRVQRNNLRLQRRCSFTKKCARMAKEQRARFYIMRRCVVMLICWRDSWFSGIGSSSPPVIYPFRFLQNNMFSCIQKAETASIRFSTAGDVKLSWRGSINVLNPLQNNLNVMGQFFGSTQNSQTMIKD